MLRTGHTCLTRCTGTSLHTAHLSAHRKVHCTPVIALRHTGQCTSAHHKVHRTCRRTGRCTTAHPRMHHTCTKCTFCTHRHTIGAPLGSLISMASPTSLHSRFAMALRHMVLPFLVSMFKCYSVPLLQLPSHLLLPATIYFQTLFCWSIYSELWFWYAKGPVNLTTWY